MWLPVMFRFPILFAIPAAWVLWLWLGKRKVRTSGAAILATAIPPTLLAITAVVLGILRIRPELPAQICLIASICLVAVAFLLSVVFAIMRDWEIAKGTGFGFGIGFVVSTIAYWAAFAFYA